MLFIKVVVAAFYSVYQNRMELLKALTLPFIGSLVLGLAEVSFSSGFLYVLFFVISLLIQTLVAITVHRMVLLGQGSVPKWGLRSWSKRETLFFVHAFLLLGLVLLVVFSPALLNFIPGFVELMISVPIVLMLVLAVWLVARFSLVFPGIAIDQGVSFKLSWRLTKGYQLLMLLVIVVFPILMALPSMMLNLIPYAAVFSNVISALMIVFEVAALSMAYHVIISEKYKNSD